VIVEKIESDPGDALLPLVTQAGTDPVPPPPIVTDIGDPGKEKQEDVR
jgi:hypothetical protein